MGLKQLPPRDIKHHRTAIRTNKNNYYLQQLRELEELDQQIRLRQQKIDSIFSSA